MASNTSVVTSILTEIKKSKVDTENVEAEKEIESNVNKSKDLKEKNTVRGKPKSGRFWKTEKERFSSVKKVKGLKQNFEKKTALRQELNRIKEISRQATEKKKEEAEAKKERRRFNLKRAEENRKKAEVVQVITNSAKLKRMRKKQLRFIEKRDTTEIAK